MPYSMIERNHSKADTIQVNFNDFSSISDYIVDRVEAGRQHYWEQANAGAEKPAPLNPDWKYELAMAEKHFNCSGQMQEYTALFIDCVKAKVNLYAIADVAKRFLAVDDEGKDTGYPKHRFGFLGDYLEFRDWVAVNIELIEEKIKEADGE
jgi:hypothetical protein